ncbi:hypothetical protein AGABI2DRAFT_198695 [Agaricus bisporus var. bisporus H97]|uniref:hypothetical protein n=1 Tax=Agaricus bisporus var. bisporus (strain H97 / ATCC MYA-4626 / FGSC 10389) TaxID=936046 RepID=UPI00029F801A|nr:hypothetical protein AGABI2DRAFT_198695 [Agaricus bisporus var. bisporus H97]EKV49679.1 hypothetical protein AGABI2DRAFT_198695 [Agaricus bisporus var. bisporus H97]
MSYLLDASAGLIGVVLIWLMLRQKPSAPLPPGPKGWPIVGNLFDMPSSREWETFTQWGEKWGDMVFLSVLGQPTLILNSAKVARDLLDKKGHKYSNRPHLEMCNLIGLNNGLVLTNYGQRFRNHRKLMHQLIGSNLSMSRFYPIEETETQKFLKHLASTPQDLASHIRRTAGAIILRISHGYEIQEKDDPIVKIVEIGTAQFSLASAPGTFIVNLIPALRHLPDWFPGAGFKQTAREWAKDLSNMIERPHQYVKEQMASGTAEPSFTADLMEDPNVTPEREADIMWSAGSLYAGGADTTVSALYAFFKAMTIYPEVAAAAQSELDTVLGPTRLPSFADRENLPYMNALVSEVLRWHSVAPIGVPHVSTEDDNCNGYFVPKGTIVITNIWKMLHDPNVYSNPMTFNPGRFLGPKPEPDPREATYGFGRRICPGRVLADSSLFISCAMALATFNITKYNLNGETMEPIVDQISGTISHPTPFKCVIKPRSEKALALIHGEI